MKKSLFALVTVLLVSCSPINGTFKANEDLSFKGIKYLMGWGAEVPVKAGEYKANISMENKKTLLLKVETGSDSATPSEIRFRIPKDSQMPSSHGDIKLAADEARQNYDLHAVVDTEYTESGVMRGTESCTWEDYRRVCRPNCYYENGRRICREECFNETITHYGTQEVEYHYSYSDKDVKIEVLRPGTEDIVATFHGTDHNSDKIYDYKGRCY